MEKLAWLVPALPLVAWAVQLLLGRRLPGGGAAVGILAVAIGWVISLAILFGVIGGADAYHVSREWAPIGASFDLPLGMIVDGLTAVMLVVVTTISLFVQIYSLSYMRGDERYTLFFANLSLFTAGMLIVVLADNLLLLLFGWEIMGICSYFLIGHYWEDVANARAAVKAFLTTRVGDLGLMAGIFVFAWAARSFEIDRIIDGVHTGRIGAATVTLGAVLLFCGAIGKSGQFPLHTWLPDAMAGPTPVSALIHAATMVTAGVFLVARTHVIFETSGSAQTVVVLVGAGTALLAAIIAIGQDDIKKILAFSTVSQLGYMFIGVGLGPIGYAAGMFHLVTHAFFKAQLFLGAGSVMHGNDEDTDIKHFGGLRSAMPLTFWTTMAAWAAIIGVPLASGWFSKDQILDAAFEHGGVGLLAWVVGVLTAGLTAFYMSRYVFLTFFGERRWPEGRHPHESPAVMTLPLVVLGFLALVAGLALSTVSGEGGRIQTFLEPVLGGPVEYESTSAALALSVVATGMAAVGAVVAWLLYIRPFDWLALRRRYPGAWRALADRLYVDQVYEFFTVNLGRALAAFLARTVDQRGIDGAVNGVAEVVGDVARSGRRVQSGLVRSYALGVLGGAVLIVAFLVFRP